MLSGNRNFEGRVQPHVRANYLASPPLVVAYALAGLDDVDLTTEPLGTDKDGEPVYLKDIWPTEREIQDDASRVDHRRDVPRASTPSVFDGDAHWQAIVPSRPAIASRGSAIDLRPATRRTSTG